MRAGRIEIGQLKPHASKLNYGAGTEFLPSFSVWFGRLGTTAEELFVAQQVNVRIDRRVRVRADLRITMISAARIGAKVYRVARVFEDASGKYYDLSLTEVSA